jgi:[acyl-carrier-protein] S-malonyltransferase
MAPAREGLEPALRQLQIEDLAVPLYRNVDAGPVTSASDLREGLVNQVDAPVQWTGIIKRMRADGFDTFVEIGTGKVLGGLIRRIERDTTTHAAGTVESINAVLGALGLGG